VAKLNKMENLAGVKGCDEQIRIELERAGLKPVKQELARSEVPYTLIGKVGNWTLTRAWYYWVAVADGNGIPLKEATEMHEKQYPDEMFDSHSRVGKYGNKIRVTGHCGCPPPKEWEENGFIGFYHIDSQAGLNEFVRVANKV
jgi:hypothetical protein